MYHQKFGVKGLTTINRCTIWQDDWIDFLLLLLLFFGFFFFFFVVVFFVVVFLLSDFQMFLSQQILIKRWTYPIVVYLKAPTTFYNKHRVSMSIAETMQNSKYINEPHLANMYLHFICAVWSVIARHFVDIQGFLFFLSGRQQSLWSIVQADLCPQ